MSGIVQIRHKAADALSKQILDKSVLERIHLGRKYNIAGWIQESYIELVRKDTLTLEELCEDPFPLDWPSIAKILYIWDSNIKEQTAGLDHWNTSLESIQENTARSTVEELFCQELEEKNMNVAADEAQLETL